MFSDEEWGNLTKAHLKFEVIKLDHNQITEIHNLPEYPVQYIELSYNEITTIVNGAFGKLQNLELLNLSHNKLKSKQLTQHTFQGIYDQNFYQPMSKLFEIHLSYNELHTLNSGLFQHTPNLGVLMLSGNDFPIIDYSTTHAISSLTQLQVKTNSVHSFFLPILLVSISDYFLLINLFFFLFRWH